ncbi:PQQ-dependent sugar dehydrogenase [Pinibacter aurantiacus]|uniref:Sorbosone dehydrogenase family protein n=1 Tax=Pinibacter aurantiacus TaxID=2851599 RepID=A0A9E2S6N3_9BACT|nr:sorbosone dehydrogenase family protein [Pinibacter aurantiacus]MBV4356741.1 sorbosone dehydrogenase family protein [Pinibacter aurantiacus]
MKTGYILLIMTIAPLLSFGQQKDTLPPPNATKSHMNFSNVKGWKDGTKPIAPEGFTVDLYYDGLQNPRWLYVLPNGDVLVAESNTHHGFFEKIGAAFVGANKSNSMKKSANRITLLRDADHDGKPEVKETFLSGLKQPFGMLLIGNHFYVGNTDALVRYIYESGATKITSNGEKLLDLPDGKINRHWTRNIITNKDNSKIYIGIGSGTDHGEKGLENEKLRGDILEVNPDGTGMRVYAAGLRNPVGMGWAPGTETLWTSVNERDELGDNLVPDYVTSVKENGFYGWPYCYWGQHIDPRVEQVQPDLVQRAIVPDVPLGSHTASLGLAFYDKKMFPEKYHNGAFITQHGSWNRKPIAGYRVLFVPFKNGKPSGDPEEFLTGFIEDLDHGKVRGRPVGIVVLQDGSMLITDDTSNKIWRVSYGRN